MTMEQLVEQVENGEFDTVLSSTSFDHRMFPDLPDGKIILTGEVFQKILDLLKATRTTMLEHGLFFYGHKTSENLLLIDDVAQFEFETGEKEVFIGRDLAYEMLSKIENGYDIVLHFHTHPSYENCCFRNFSDQDLYLYGFCQSRFDFRRRGVSFLGGMGCSFDLSGELKFVSYDERLRQYFKINDVYYSDQSDFMKIGSLDSIPTIRSDTVERVSALEKKKLLGQMH